MRVWIAAVGAKPRAAFEELARLYLERMAPYLAGVEAPVFKSEAALWTAIEKERARTTVRVVLLDEHGKQMGSEEFAQWLGRERDEGRQLVIFAVGPGDGWKGQGAGYRVQGAGKRSVFGDQRSEGQRTAYSGQRSDKAGRGVGPGPEVMLLSLGAVTMAHELARVVVCEQVYRALTILAGHPYHRGNR
ncbi:MAG: 23S rRNA (pseudouridine(1915)-N(3))-methyltransferase RlmH [Acidobacteriaceae bacterium]